MLAKDCKYSKTPWRMSPGGIILNADGFGVANFSGSAFMAKKGMIGEIEDNRDGQLPGGYVVSDAQRAEADANAQLCFYAPKMHQELLRIASDHPETCSCSTCSLLLQMAEKVQGERKPWGEEATAAETTRKKHA